MSLTVGQLLEIEHLGLSLEAGEGGLTREITWTHVCELSDPRPWLDGGEFMMTTGLALPRRARTQVGYLDRLCEARAAALGVAQGMSAPPLTAAMRKQADKAGLPVLRVSYEVPFIAISQVVVAANHKSFERRMLTSLSIFDSLRRGTTVLGSAATVVARLETVGGYALAIASRERTLIYGDGTLLGLLEECPWVPSGRSMVEVSRANNLRQYVLPLSVGGKFSGILLAREHEPGSGLGTVALQNIATVAGVQLAAIRRFRDLHFHIALEVFEDLFTFSTVLDESVVRRRVELAGMRSELPLVLLAVTGIAEGAEYDLYGALCDRGTLTLVRRQEGLVWLAMMLADYEKLAGCRGVVDLLSPQGRLGASRPVASYKDLAAAASEARWALAEACRRQVSAVEAGASAPTEEHASWLPRDRHLLEHVASATLGPIVSDHGRADLLGSLEVYLEEGQHVDAACRRLGVHRHTLSYRLRRIEQLTGRSLRDVDNVVEFWRALRARAVLEPFGEDGVHDGAGTGGDVGAPGSRRALNPER